MAYVVRAIPLNKNFRAFAVECRDIVETVRKLQALSPIASAALGRALAGVALLSADLKTGKILLQINGGGPLGEILAEGNWKGELRGTVKNPHVYLEIKSKKLPVGEAVGKKGFISVVRDLGLKEVYQSSSKLVSGEIAEDLAYFLTVSEQIPSAVSLGVLVGTDGSILAAGGFLIQKLPEAKEEEIAEFEKILKNFPPITTLLSQGNTPEDILKMLFSKIKILERRKLKYKCSCTQERVESMLVALGEKELEDFVKKKEPVEVICHFCRKKYVVPLDRVKAILEKLRNKS
ncbi:MAG: Redox-regulated molecular chaperone [Thermodesulfobacterium sp.]|uniref:33 kDa chaperonin n=1 Tax=Candidatus Thermodesulfobacterium syntrophicum TaxID=3060442 RepID=A0AAE3P4C2_9BACT|nr:Redox-regulated molecular chaperone [Candidatus Thermodesulfobacterium syntrophicum]